jgi:two-component system CheB/CheR fusion protein
MTAEEAVGEHLMNLDIGLPVDKLHGPIRTVLSDGSDRHLLDLEATNRRGRTIFCRVELVPLHTDGTTEGAILLMTGEDRQ